MEAIRVKKYYKPFWSYDAKKTENWLQIMALQGYFLEDIRPLKRLFIFQEGNDSQVIHYHIAYDKTKKHLFSNTLQYNGWRAVCHKGSWCILQNKRHTKDLKAFPIRDGIIKRNRKLLYFYIGLFIYLFLTTILFFTLISITVFFYNDTLTFSPMSFWLAVSVTSIILWLLTMYSAVRLYQTNKKFL
jgi:hypothetical protein